MRKPILISVAILFAFTIYSCSVDEIDTPTQSTIVPIAPEGNASVFTKTIADTLQLQESRTLMVEMEQGDKVSSDMPVHK